MSESATARFDMIVSRSEQDFNLAEASLLIATQCYPDLHVGAYLAKLDRIAAHVREQLEPFADHVATIKAMNQYLFHEEGFSGNLQDYSDPRNSFLNDVLDRKLGIPLTLSLIYVEIGWRLGVPLQGVSFPGHFLVKFPHKDGEVVLDPFFKGISLGEDDLELRVRQVLGEDMPARDYVRELLVGTTKKDMIVRLLRNLRNVYSERQEYETALAYAQRMLVVSPDDATELRERADLYYRLDCFRPALADYSRYLENEPEASDADAVRERVIELYGQTARLH